jgi:transposase-like protein
MIKKKQSQIEKICLKNINEGKYTPIDMSEYYDRQHKAYLEDVLRYEKETKQERQRIEKLECPICNSKEKKYHCESKNNGIIGPGYHSTITNEYYICEKCGIHYSDLNKKEIKSIMKKYY